MRPTLVAALVLSLAAPVLCGPALAEPPPPSQRPASRVDFPGFTTLASEVQPYRASRMVSLEAFHAMATEAGTLILDARSESAYRRGHIGGAVNLPLTDFTAARLAEVIGPDRNRRILIYCNNNFSDNVDPVPLKAITLALNIQTFVNLYGYGYRNIYELSDSVPMADPLVGWVRGTTAPTR